MTITEVIENEGGLDWGLPLKPQKGLSGAPNSSSSGELKEDVDGGHRVHRLAVAQGGFETHAFGSPDSGFVKSVTQSANYAQNFHFAGNGEVYLEQDFAFDFQAASFLGVNRVWLGKNLGRG